MSDDNVFTPTNEQGVVYLFSKYHEKLGFERILHIGTRFPDMTAMRDGKETRIELEFLLSGLQSHYIIKNAIPDREKWVREYEDEDRIRWRLWRRQTTNPVSQNYNTWIKRTAGISLPKERIKNVEKWDGALVWKSLKPFCDVVICWEADCEIDDPDIEIVELKTSLCQTIER